MERVKQSCFFSSLLKDLKRRPCGIDLWLFQTIRTNYEKASHIGVFLKFFPDYLKLERLWAFTFLGSLNPRDRNIDYNFMYFSGSLNKTKKWLMKHSSFSFKLHKNERTKKEWGFYAQTSFMQQSIESSSNLALISRLCQMGGLSIPSESWLFLLSLYTPLTGYSSDHPWHLVFVSSSQSC